MINSTSEFVDMTESASDGDTPSRNARKDYRSLEPDIWSWTMAECEKTGELPTKMAIRQHAQKVYHTAGLSSFIVGINLNFGISQLNY